MKTKMDTGTTGRGSLSSHALPAGEQHLKCLLSNGVMPLVSMVQLHNHSPPVMVCLVIKGLAVTTG